MPVFLLSFIALFGVSHASDSAPPEPSLWFKPTFRSVCKPIPSTMSLCHGIGYRSMWIPNMLGHDSLREVQQQSAAWLPLISKHCHRDTKKFLCSLFAPVCLPEVSGPVSPCRNLCEAVRDGCVPVMSAFGFPWPYMFNCTRFPHETELCIPVSEEQDGRETEEAKHEEVPKGQCTKLSFSTKTLLFWEVLKYSSTALRMRFARLCFSCSLSFSFISTAFIKEMLLTHSRKASHKH